MLLPSLVILVSLKITSCNGGSRASRASSGDNGGASDGASHDANHDGGANPLAGRLAARRPVNLDSSSCRLEPVPTSSMQRKRPQPPQT